MQIITIRHAATPFNQKELINGSIDENLSSKGRKQIPEIIESLAKYKFDVIYASPMKRSLQTAKPIAEHYKVDLKQDPRLTEVGLGSFEGQAWDSTIPIFGINSSGVLSSCDYDFTPYGGENSDQVRARVQSFIDDLRTSGHQRPLIVCHGGIIRWFYFLCTGTKTGRIPNLSVFVFDV
jgi:alpha-ribazole phosphatase